MRIHFIFIFRQNKFELLKLTHINILIMNVSYHRGIMVDLSISRLYQGLETRQATRQGF